MEPVKSSGGARAGVRILLDVEQSRESPPRLTQGTAAMGGGTLRPEALHEIRLFRNFIMRKGAPP